MPPHGAPELLVLAHSVAVAADVDDVAVVQQPVDERGGHDFVAEHGARLLEALVRGEHGGGLLVAGVDELDEQHRAFACSSDSISPARVPW